MSVSKVCDLLQGNWQNIGYSDCIGFAFPVTTKALCRRSLRKAFLWQCQFGPCAVRLDSAESMDCQSNGFSIRCSSANDCHTRKTATIAICSGGRNLYPHGRSPGVPGQFVGRPRGALAIKVKWQPDWGKLMPRWPNAPTCGRPTAGVRSHIVEAMLPIREHGMAARPAGGAA